MNESYQQAYHVISESFTLTFRWDKGFLYCCFYKYNPEILPHIVFISHEKNGWFAC